MSLTAVACPWCSGTGGFIDGGPDERWRGPWHPGGQACHRCRGTGLASHREPMGAPPGEVGPEVVRTWREIAVAIEAGLE